jgi:sulfur-carrier protein
MMQVQVKYFAALREALGPGQTVLTQARTVAELRDELIALGGAHAQWLDRSRPVRAAIDQAMCAESQALHDGCELAFFPPVTGG